MKETWPIMKFDPFNCTNFNRTDQELENFFVFCVFVAGKRADMTAKKVNQMLDDYPHRSALQIIREQLEDSLHTLDTLLRKYKFGKYNLYKKCFKKAIHLDLRNCTVDDLESIPGIGPKTARYFIVHSRANAQVAALDTHILRYMREELSIETPKTTPSGKKYLELENKFIQHAKNLGKPIAELDLAIWKEYTISKTT